jgi:hypothetical protein
MSTRRYGAVAAFSVKFFKIWRPGFLAREGRDQLLEGELQKARWKERDGSICGGDIREVLTSVEFCKRAEVALFINFESAAPAFGGGVLVAARVMRLEPENLRR